MVQLILKQFLFNKYLDFPNIIINFEQNFKININIIDFDYCNHKMCFAIGNIAG